ncbi:MAG: nucleotidyltransferase domain-containing protein [Candidatus Scalindua sp.]
MSKSDFLTEKEKMVVERFSSRLKSALGKNLILVKLIGSKARGDFSSESDIDILIIVKDYLSDKEKVIDILYNIDPYYDVKISPIIYSEFEYEKNKELESPFIIKVEKDGINL